MKAEYSDERDNTDTRSIRNPILQPPNMFSKFHQPPPPQQPPLLHHPHPQYHPHLHPHPNPHFQYSRDSQTSEEADSAAAAAAGISTPPSKKAKTVARSDDGGGETIEVVRRPRGRPPGSKNRPKPAPVITREPDPPSMAPYILEIPAGADIVESLMRITRRRKIGLCVLSGSGAVANVTLRQPAGSASLASGVGTVTFHGRFELASLAAVILPGGNVLGGSEALVVFGGNNAVNGGAFTVTLSAPQGHVVGGKVVGPLLAAGTVYIVAASFNNPTFHTLPLREEGLGEEDGGHQQEVGSPAVSGSCGEGSGDMGGGGGGGGGMYNCQGGGPEVIWAPTARPPAPY